MLSYFFRKPNLSNQELLNLTLKYFNPWATCEVEMLFETTQNMLKNLNPDDSNFLAQFDKIVFGTMAKAFELEDNQKGIRSYRFPPSYNNQESTETTILAMGEKLQTKEIILTSAEIETNFSDLIDHVPTIKNRLFALTNPSYQETITEADNKKGWCNIL